MTLKVITTKKCKIKIIYSNSHVDETYLWPREHRLKSSKKKKMQMHQLPSLTRKSYN